MRATTLVCGLGAVAILSCVLSVAPAVADTMGINFASGRGGVLRDMAAAETAGVIPQASWQNIHEISNSGTGILNSEGVELPVGISWSGNYVYDTTNASQTNDAQLMNGFLDATNEPGYPNLVTVALSNIPYTKYDVYAYVGSNNNGNVGHASIQELASSTRYFVTNDSPFGGYVEATATTLETAASANYIVWRDLTGSGFTYTQSGDGTTSCGWHGMQIVNTAVPEPSSILLLLSGVFGLLYCVWRNR